MMTRIDRQSAEGATGDEPSTAGPDSLSSAQTCRGLRRLLEGAGMVVRADGTFIEAVAARPHAGFGPDPASLVGRPIGAAVPESTASRVRLAIDATLDTGEVQTLQYDLTVGGEPRRFEGRLTAVGAGDDDREAVLWVTEDVTDRPADRDGVEQLFERVLETSPVGIVVVKPTGAISLANDRAGAILGVDPETITARDHTDPEWRITHDDGTPVADADHPVTRVLETGEPVFGFEHRIERSDGTERWLSSNSAPIRDADGRVERVVVGFEDMTQLKRREQQQRTLVETEDQADVGGWRLDLETDCLVSTTGMARLHGTSEYNPSLSDELACYHPDDRETLRDAITTCRDTGSPFELELRRETAAGHTRWVDVSGERVPGSASDYVRGVVRDVTAKKEREQRLTVLSRVFRHNIRNELNVVIGHTEQLQETIDRLERQTSEDGAPRKAASGQCLEESGASQSRPTSVSASSVSSLVATAQASIGEVEAASQRLLSTAETARRFQAAIQWDDIREPVDVRQPVTRLVREYADRYPAATFDVDCDAVMIPGNQRAVRQILEISLDNALEHTDRPAPVVSIDVSRADDDRVTVSIVDDGPGIPKAERAIVADGGETPMHHGSGLGLWVQTWLTKRLGGEVSISENDPRGTTVILTLPAVNPR